MDGRGGALCSGRVLLSVWRRYIRAREGTFTLGLGCFVLGMIKERKYVIFLFRILVPICEIYRFTRNVRGCDLLVKEGRVLRRVVTVFLAHARE